MGIFLRAYCAEDYLSLKPILDDAFGVGYFDCNKLSNENCVVADMGTAAGMIYCEDHLGELEVRTIAVRYDLRNQGIALCLLNHLVSTSVSNNIKRLWSPAWVERGRVPGAKLLVSAGFALTSEISDYWLNDSIQRQYACPACGMPCRCSAQIFEKLLVAY